MTNEQIIANVAISEGIYTEEEVNNMIEVGKEIPLHTLQGWNARGKLSGKTIKIKRVNMELKHVYGKRRIRKKMTL